MSLKPAPRRDPQQSGLGSSSPDAGDGAEAALAAAGIGIWRLDVASGLFACDQRCRTLWGFGERSVVTLTDLLAHVHVEDRVRVQQALGSSKGGSTTVNCEFRIAVFDRPETWLRAIGQVQVHGGAARALGIVQDIAVEKGVQRELEREKQRAEQANRTKDEFLAMLGHELRNPLSPILTALELMRLRGGEVLMRERTIIERQVKHMVRLVDDLLDVSRMTRGKVALKKSNSEISDIITQAIEMASPLLEQRAHRLITSIPTSRILVQADKHRLAQVIANLLTNAAKYTPPGGNIEVGVHADDQRVHVRVRDNGIGIDPEILPHIFELFVQGKRSIDRAEGGLGLGLSIAKTLIELHDGTISARSAGLGHGSEFLISLPVLQPPVDSYTSERMPVAAYVPPEYAKSILVVDDNRDAAEVLAEALQAAGYTTEVAFDGPSALDLTQNFRPDLALLDIGLPVMDGYELAKRLRELPWAESLKLVAVTGYGQQSDRDRSQAAGFHEHLVKPIDLARIQNVVERLIGAPPLGRRQLN